jgi:hypothetical protein
MTEPRQLRAFSPLDAVTLLALRLMEKPQFRTMMAAAQAELKGR